MEINKIYNEDCLDTMARMPDDFIDVAITSPPYNKNGVCGGLVRKVEYDGYNDCIDEEQYQELQIKILNELFRVSKKCFYNHKIRYNKFAIHPMEIILKTKWKLHQEVVWNRNITGNIRAFRCWNIDERIYWLVKKQPNEIPQQLAQLTSVWNITPERKSPHPAPFPIEIPDRCVLIGSNEGDLVYDPFMGSGTTAISCIKYKRNWIGSEISKEYVDLAYKRLKPYLAQTTLF